jgi:hypothetical protein
MANTTIALRSSATVSAQPSLGVIANGELSINFADGIIYYKTSSNTLGSIRTTQPSGLTTEVQFNDAGSFGSNASLTFTTSTGLLSANSVTTNNSIIKNLTAGAILITNASNTVISLANTGTAGTYANASHIPVITTDVYGRVSGITNTAIQAATTSVNGIVQLNDTITSTSTTQAATANATKLAYTTASGDAVAFAIALG